jgi:NADH dehydrogenase [ubiquinone] 1 alpha subcomplex assembly factor 7
MRLHLVETSPVCATASRNCRCRRRPGSNCRNGTAGRRARRPLLLVANELFDALPIHQFERSDTGWRERAVGCDAMRRPGFTCRPAAFARSIRHACAAAGHRRGVARFLVRPADRLPHRRRRRCALIVDYGSARPTGQPTLQAVRGHRRHDPLEAPGTADLTAHVDFGALARAAGEMGAAVWGPVTQRDLLDRLGIRERASQLAADATPAQAADIEAVLPARQNEMLFHNGDHRRRFTADAGSTTS